MPQADLVIAKVRQHIQFPPNAVVTCEIKFFQNYLNLRRRPFEIILIRRVETCVKLFQNYFICVLQLTNIFQHVCDVAEIILK